MHKVKRAFSAGCSLLSVHFLFSALILVLAAAALRPSIAVLAKHYTKKTIPIRRSLKEFDVFRLPLFQYGWVKSDILPESLGVESIGTNEYAIIKLTRKDPDKVPQRMVLFISYYSNPNDKVPHTPDVCYRQMGAIVKKMTTITLDTPELAPQYSQIQANLLIFQMQEPKCDQVVIYCFCVEGQIRHSREQTRWVIAKPGNRYSYFSKIEVVANYPVGGDNTQVIETCKTAFREALQILLTEYLPLREDLKRN